MSKASDKAFQETGLTGIGVNAVFQLGYSAATTLQQANDPSAAVIAGWIRDEVIAAHDAGELLYLASEWLGARILAAFHQETGDIGTTHAENGIDTDSTPDEAEMAQL